MPIPHIVPDHDPEIEPRLLHPAPGVWVRQALDNCGWIELADGLAFIDTLEQPELAAEVDRLLAEQCPGQPVRWVLNTHLHRDHVALNPHFAACGATILNARTVTLPPAGLVVGQRLRLIPLGGAHTAEDAVVWDPETRTLFAGDLFGWGLIPWDRPLTRETHARVRQVVQAMLDLKPLTVVPGHGPLVGPEHLHRWLAYYAWLECELRNQLGRGVPEAELIDGDALPPPEDMRNWWRFTLWKHRDSVKKLARAIRLNRL